jgi:transposase
MDYTTYVGLDVHKDTISVAVAKEGDGNSESLGQIPNTRESLLKLLKRLAVSNERLAFCYEAGPCGYEIYRFLKERGIYCVVVAPSLVPVKAGDRVKTDKRDAKKLARLFRSGELTAVWVPDEEQEALRDLVRLREDALEDLQRKRHQLSKFLLRNGKRLPMGVNPWTHKHRQWLDALKFDQPAQQFVLQDYIYALDISESRLKRLTQTLEEKSRTTVHAPVVAALRALKGVDYLTAITLVAELGDISRFSNPAQLMAYAGVVPSEHSSGQRQRRGGITKTGNSHVRRVVIEAAWHYRRQPRVSVKLKKRQECVSETVKEISWKAQNRLNSKFRKLLARGKPSQKAVVAVAREMLGFIWSISCQVNEDLKKAA